MSANAFCVRAALRDDATAIARIFVESWRESYAGLLPANYLVRLSEVRQRLLWTREIVHAGPRDGVVVAEHETYGVIGFASFGPARDSAVGYDGEVYTIYVDPNHLGGGVGHALIRAAFARLTADGFRSAVVWALKGNPARYFYENEGGRLVAERPGAIAGKPVREIAFGFADIASASGARVG
ncbi:MAG: GNAT family N-acetyltransferase [Alphaproteobacteria bacterium]